MTAEGIFAKQGPFIVVPTWVFDRLAPENPRILQIYVCLASYADRDGMCWPTLGAVGDLVQIDAKTVGRATARLDELGLIAIEPQYRSDGSRMGNAYRLCLPPTPLVSGGHPTSVPAEGTRPIELEPTTADAEKRGGKSISEQLWDTLCLVCKINSDEVTKTGRGELNSAVRELKDVGATPQEILRRSVAWKRQYPNIALTPSALKKHWGHLTPVDSNVRELYPDREPVEYVGRQEVSTEEKERGQDRLRELSERFRSERT